MTARLVLPNDAPKSEWLAARRKGITASEIAVLLGISPYDSPFNLYWKKLGEIPEDYDNDAMSLGRHLEPWIADRWATDHPEFGVDLAGLFASDERPWQMATPDRLLWSRAAMDGAVAEASVSVDPFEIPSTVSLLEIKSSGSYDGWGEDGTDEIPAYYRAQVLWQLDTLGLTEAHVVCLFLSSRQLRNYTVAYDEADVLLMRAAAVDFMELLADRQPPAIDHHAATTSALKQLNPKVEDADAELDPDLTYAYRQAKRQLDEARDEYDLITNEVRAAMGNAKYAVSEGAKVATRSIYTVAEHVRKESHVDKIVPARAQKEAS